MTVILVIEDEVEIRHTLKDILGLDDYQVLEAADGREGVQMARQHAPDLIISDILMPGIDGYEVFQELKRDLSTANIPFIFLSALSTYDNVRMGMNIGADDYLTKPFDYNQVSTAVSARLQRHIERENIRLRELNTRLIQMQERNYKQIANILTNALGEPLKGLNLLLSITSELDANVVKEIHQVVEGLVEQVSSISLQLHPTMLEHLGMLSIIRWLSEVYQERHNLSVSFLHAGLHDSIPASTKITIYRILDEALLNIAQHAQINTAEVKLRLRKEQLELDIIDSGVGFNVDAILDEAATTGLQTMMARTRYMGGEVNIRSIQDAGTHIQVILPVGTLEEDTPLEVLPPAVVLPELPIQPSHQWGVLLAEDHDIIRQGIRRLLEHSNSFDLFGEATNGNDVLPFIRQQEPDILILDMSIDGLTGMEVLRTVRKQHPNVKVLAFSPYKEEIYALEAIKNGAAGYILTESPSIEILQALDMVAKGEQYITSALSLHKEASESMITEFSEQALERPELTSREREILLLVSEGLTSAEIGERLSISRRTVEKHRSNLMKKLGVKNHMQLLAYVMNQQL